MSESHAQKRVATVCQSNTTCFFCTTNVRNIDMEGEIINEMKGGGNRDL